MAYRILIIDDDAALLKMLQIYFEMLTESRRQKEIILEVTENLLSNALRYGKQQIVITVRMAYSELRICVRDDGEGFQEDIEKITEAFHGKNVKDSLKHAGIGMYISRLYCEKHGGRLVLENDEQGGAVVTAVFCRIA